MKNYAEYGDFDCPPEDDDDAAQERADALADVREQERSDGER